MKTIVTIVFIVVLFGCKESNSERKEVAINNFNKVEPIDVIKAKNITIPVYDYDSFEKLIATNDTKTYVVNFWATWCKPCVEELPSFEKIYNKYKGQNVEVILVSLDFPKKVDDVLVPFIEKNKLKSNVILLDDPKQNRWIPKVDKNWSGAIPATIIINKNNRSFYEKSFTFIELEDQLKGFITN